MAALVILAVLLLLAVTVAVALLVTSLRFPSDTAAFPCKLRPAPPGGRPATWPRRRRRATWIHDVLLVRRGMPLPRIEALQVRTPDDRVRETTAHEIPGLGAAPVAVVLRLDDGTLLEVACPGTARDLLVGPFLAAAVPHRPRGRRGQRNIDH
jgi:hypothetical protein